MAALSDARAMARPTLMPKSLPRKAARRCETPLDWLRRRKDADGKPAISQTEYEAGLRMRDAYERAQCGRAITMDWDRFGGAGRPPRGAPGLDFSEAGAAARARLDRALSALGPGLADIVILVCCRERGLSEAEAALGWPKRSAKLVLRLALARLAAHYGLAETRKAYGPGGGGRAWLAAGARPEIDG